MSKLLSFAQGPRVAGPAGWALALVRVGFGLGMLLGHGLPKLMEFSARSATFSDPLGVGSLASLSLAVFAEVFCAALVILGLFTRAAAIPVAITMATVVFIVKGGDVLGGGELAALYGLGYLALVIGGGGRFSLGNLIKR
jgi:putative oxidoreductase